MSATAAMRLAGRRAPSEQFWEGGQLSSPARSVNCLVQCNRPVPGRSRHWRRRAKSANLLISLKLTASEISKCRSGRAALGNHNDLPEPFTVKTHRRPSTDGHHAPPNGRNAAFLDGDRARRASGQMPRHRHSTIILHCHASFQPSTFEQFPRILFTIATRFPWPSTQGGPQY